MSSIDGADIALGQVDGYIQHQVALGVNDAVRAVRLLADVVAEGKQLACMEQLGKI